MMPYKNLDGNSGVIAYEIEENAIQVEFVNGGIYLYTYSSTGKEKIEEMKKRADKGKGLATYINRHVRSRYEKK